MGYNGFTPDSMDKEEFMCFIVTYKGKKKELRPLLLFTVTSLLKKNIVPNSQEIMTKII